MLLVDRQTLQVVTANDSALKFYGYSRPALRNLSLADIQREQHSGEIEQSIDRLHEPEVAAVPRIHVTASGEQRTVRINGRVIEHEGHPTVLVAVFDMTDQLRMEEEVRRSREFLRNVLDHIPTAVFVKDMGDEGRHILCNKATEAVYGRPSTDVLGVTDREILHREDAERIEKSDQAALQLGSIGTVDDELLKRADGSERLIRTRRVSLSDRPGLARVMLLASPRMSRSNARLRRGSPSWPTMMR